MNTYTDCAVIFFIMVAIITFDSVITLLSIFKDGILKNKQDILLEKTNKELKSMLTGVNKISNLNKNQLVELIMQNA